MIALSKQSVAYDTQAEARRLRIAVLTAAWAVMAISLLGLGIWHSHSAWLLDHASWIFETRYNTALLFFICGTGLWAAMHEKPRLTLAAGIFTLFAGALTLLQYILTVDFGIDQLLMPDYPHSDLPYPGRPAPNTALAFIGGGIFLVMAALKRHHSLLHSIAMEILGFMTFAIGTAAIAGYLQGAAQAYTWGTFTRMAPMTAILCMTLGAGFLAIAWQRQETKVARVPLWLPPLLCFAALLFDISTPFEVAAGFVYIPLVFCGLWFTRPHATFVFATMATLLALLGYFSSDSEKWGAIFAIINRTLSIGVLWFIAALIYLRRKGEMALLESQSKLRAVVDHAVDGLITINARGLIETFNPTCERIFGYAAQEVIGKNIKMLMPEPYHSEHDGYLSRYLQTGEAKIIGTTGREVAAKRKDGSIFPIDLAISAFTLSDGKHFSGIIRDITARKAAEREVQESEERYRALVEASSQIIWTWKKGNLEKNSPLSRWWEATTGQPSENIATFGWLEVVHPDDRERVKKIWEVAMSERKGFEMDYRLRTRDGKYLHVAVRGVPLLATDGSVREFIGSLNDITARKEAEDGLRRYTQALERSNKELDDFAYIASHDLKEPLRGIHNHSRFLLEDNQEKLNSESVNRLNRLVHLSQRMERLVNDLLYFSRLGRQEMAIQRTDLNEIIHDIETTLEIFLQERQARITVPQKLPTLTCDKPRITEALRNLITNAVKYNDKPERIVEIGFLPSQAAPHGKAKSVIYVRDNGVGIAPEFHQEIFRIFKRLQNNADGKEEGTGVGLTFVKKIIERHGGKIWLESEPGKGTIFYFTLEGVSYDTKAAA